MRIGCFIVYGKGGECMNWLKMPNVKDDTYVCLVNVCWNRQKTNNYCAIQYDLLDCWIRT